MERLNEVLFWCATITLLIGLLTWNWALMILAMLTALIALVLEMS